MFDNVQKNPERAFRRPDDLLDAWLAALNQFDPMRRRVAQIAQIAPQQIRQASATIPAIFRRSNLVRLV